MSRIGRTPISLPKGVSVETSGRTVKVKGPKGDLSLELRPEIEVSIDDGVVTVAPNGMGSGKSQRAYHGMTRALIGNMVEGVSEGFSKTLEIVGVGWNAAAQGKQLSLNIGFNQPRVFPLPAGIECETPNATTIVIKGPDKQTLGQFAAHVRAVRPPEPYKGKGIRYQGEYVKRKAGKSFGS